MDGSRVSCYADIFSRAFRQAPWNEEWSTEAAARRITDVMDTPNFFGMEYLWDGRIAGFIMGNGNWSHDGVHCEIKEFCVDSGFQGQGIGEKLLDEYLKYLERQNVKSTYLLTARGERTEGFYSKRGFRSSDTMIFMGR